MAAARCRSLQLVCLQRSLSESLQSVSACCGGNITSHLGETQRVPPLWPSHPEPNSRLIRQAKRNINPCAMPSRHCFDHRPIPPPAPREVDRGGFGFGVPPRRRGSPALLNAGPGTQSKPIGVDRPFRSALGAAGHQYLEPGSKSRLAEDGRASVELPRCCSRDVPKRGNNLSMRI
jgi:hypothetical protein